MYQKYVDLDNQLTLLSPPGELLRAGTIGVLTGHVTIIEDKDMPILECIRFAADPDRIRQAFAVGADDFSTMRQHPDAQYMMRVFFEVKWIAERPQNQRWIPLDQRYYITSLELIADLDN